MNGFSRYREYKAKCVICDKKKKNMDTSVATLQVFIEEEK
jgi:hypothetical protein